MKVFNDDENWRLTTPFGNYDFEVEEGRLDFTTALGNNIAASQKKVAFALHRARERRKEAAKSEI